MRLLLALFALTALAPHASFAQDKAEKQASKTQTATDKKAAVEDVKSKIDWVAVESTGIISGGKSGALEKTLWKGQKRSEIEFLLSRLPTAPHLRSVISLQRRLLLSKTDSSLIENDIGPLRGNDLLIQRMNKLMDMGLYDDAWELYTQKAEDPYDVSIARIGMVLLVMRNDLATACLEEKVFSSRYGTDAFFNMLDRACSQTLGSTAKPSFPDSKVLQSVYNDAGYGVSAASFANLVQMTDLERALVLANGKIRYTGLTKDVLQKTPSALLPLYLMDKTIPADAAAMVKAETTLRGLTPYIISVSRDEGLKKVQNIPDIPSRWPGIESALADSSRLPADMRPFADMIAEAKPEQLSTATLLKSLNVMLSANHELPEFWVNAAQQQAKQKPIIYIYLKAFKSLTPTKIPSLDDKAVLAALSSLKPQDMDQIIAIIDTLDKDAGLAANSLKAYDKHLGLTLENNYVMPTVGLNILLETAPEQKQSGITVLAVLNSLAAKPDLMYSGSVRKVLYSMLNVGLIEDAKTTGSEIVASVLNKY